MQRHHELSDEEWARLRPLLPRTETPGRHYRDHRQILNGMLYWLHMGVPWRYLPERYGPWQTVYSRLRRWSRDGLWDRILSSLQRELDGAGSIEWELWCIDGSNVRAHKAAAGAGNRARCPRNPSITPWAEAVAGSAPSFTCSLMPEGCPWRCPLSVFRNARTG